MSGFANTKCLADKAVSLDELAPGLYGYTAEGGPNSAMVVPQLQRDHADCWAGLRKRLDPAPNARTP